jgi:hypothetical protein
MTRAAKSSSGGIPGDIPPVSPAHGDPDGYKAGAEAGSRRADLQFNIAQDAYVRRLQFNLSQGWAALDAELLTAVDLENEAIMTRYLAEADAQYGSGSSLGGLKSARVSGQSYISEAPDDSI